MILAFIVVLSATLAVAGIGSGNTNAFLGLSLLAFIFTALLMGRSKNGD